MGDTSFFFRYDIYSIFYFFTDIDTDIDVFSTNSRGTEKALNRSAPKKFDQLISLSLAIFLWSISQNVENSISSW